MTGLDVPAVIAAAVTILGTLGIVAFAWWMSRG